MYLRSKQAHTVKQLLQVFTMPSAEGGSCRLLYSRQFKEHCSTYAITPCLMVQLPNSHRNGYFICCFHVVQCMPANYQLEAVMVEVLCENTAAGIPEVLKVLLKMFPFWRCQETSQIMSAAHIVHDTVSMQHLHCIGVVTKRRNVTSIPHHVHMDACCNN